MQLFNLNPYADRTPAAAPAEPVAHVEAPALDPVLTTSQLAARLGVPIQTLYDLRSQGRGPRGFRVGRELRFRLCEVEAWLSRLEADDDARHPREPR
ncbi:helix-turn-helix domain-containing protein [Nocardioides sp. GY 10113]|uniref:helix-turn-helix transcriptional regulator n=1 Tax=Nocardioides sp. GY 10113 TaxID=2569761 RepID=UPI0010A85779|nr:helix-turn-helix domain-containing protein [Nocardioides sp. GY 10113]TIC88244.1 helix-turn-helix domain-containing protein [Nocardioides sp. GY 10113]